MTEEASVGSLLVAGKRLLDEADATAAVPGSDQRRPHDLREEALAQFILARHLEPDYSQANQLLGQALLELERPDQAQAKFLRALQGDPENLDASLGAGRAFHALDRPAEALEHLEAVTSRAPWVSAAWNSRAQCLRELGRNQEAVKVYKEAANSQLAYTWPQLAGDLLKEMGDHASAAAQYREACSRIGATQDPEGVFARTGIRLNLVTVLLQLERYAEAEREASDTIADLEALDLTSSEVISQLREAGMDPSAPTDARLVGIGVARLSRALSRFGQKRYSEALVDLDEARRQPSLALVSLQIQAGLHLHRGMYREFWHDLSQADEAWSLLEVNGTHGSDEAQVDEQIERLRTYAQLCRWRGDSPDQIESLYEQARALREEHGTRGSRQPVDAILWTDQASFYLERKQEVPAEAESLAWKARQLLGPVEETVRSDLGGRETPWTLVRLGAVLVLMEEDEVAEVFLKKAIDQDHSLDLAHANLGLALSRRGDLEGAANSYRNALKHDPDHLVIANSLASVHLRLGALELAEKQYRRVTAVAEANLEAWLGLANVYMAKADAMPKLDGGAESDAALDLYAEARDCLLKVLDLNAELSDSLDARRAWPRLSPPVLAGAHYDLGYLYTKLKRAKPRNPLARRTRGPLLAHARRSFEQALKLDPTHAAATRAVRSIEAAEQRSGSQLVNEDTARLALIAICFLLLSVVQAVFFFGFLSPKINPTEYAALTFGILAFAIATISLPDLLKLKVPGVEVEKKTAVERIEVTQLEIPRSLKEEPVPAWFQADLSQLMPRGPTDAPKQPTPDTPSALASASNGGPA